MPNHRGILYEMNKTEIESYLQHLEVELARMEVVGEIVLHGGAAMVLAHKARVSTKDVDAVMEPKSVIYEAAARVERSDGAPQGWLNDAVKGFVSAAAKADLLYDWPHLKVYVASADYLLAMKCLSMRLGKDETDLQDVRFLMNKLNLHNPEDIFNLIERFYPQRLIQPKTRFAIIEICQEAESHG